MSASSHRRTPPPRPARRRAWWRRPWIARAASAVVVLAVGVGVWIGVERAEQQSCETSAFQATNDIRTSAIEDLLRELLALNRDVRSDDPDVVAAARARFDVEASRIETVRSDAQAATDRARREGGCA